MTITYFGAGALVQNASSITPAYPASTVAGQLAILQVVSATTAESTPSTPSGWTLVETLSGGGGTFGSSAGPRRLTFFVRELAGGDAAPTTTVPSGTGSVISGQITVLARSGGTGWRYAATSGPDTSSGTGFSAACSDSLTWAVGDFVVLGYALAGGTASLTVETAAATGITFGTMTERGDTNLTVGNLGRTATATLSVNAGAATQPPTVTATLAVASTGVAGLLRIRQATAAISATAQTVFPPRNLVSVTAMAADDIVTATIYRQYGTAREPVRAASSVDVTSIAALLRVDAEQPFGVAVSYAADLVDVNGAVWTITSSSITSTVAGDIISDAVQGIGALVVIEPPWEKARDRDASTSNVGGRMIIVSRRRSGASAPVTVRTETDAAGDDLDQVLQGATEGVVQIRKQNALVRLDGHYAIVSDTERPTWYDEYRWWDLSTVETEPWPDSLEAAGFTLQDIADNYSTLGDLNAAFPGTLLDIALFDFGP